MPVWGQARKAAQLCVSRAPAKEVVKASAPWEGVLGVADSPGTRTQPPEDETRDRTPEVKVSGDASGDARLGAERSLC